MSIFVLRRILTLAATLVGASLIIFLVLDALPGNAAQLLMGADASPDAVRALTVKLGLYQPLLCRYVHWIQGMAVGDLGNSYVYGTPVVELIAERLVLTIPLAIMSMLITVVLALAAGIHAAANHNRVGDIGVMSLTQIGIALPNFWFAILLILLFAVKLRWLSAGGFAGWGRNPLAAAASDFAGTCAGRDPRARHTFGRPRGRAGGFRADRARQGLEQTRGAVGPRPAQRHDSRDDGDGPAIRPISGPAPSSSRTSSTCRGSAG